MSDKHEPPNKPETMKGQVDQLWEAVYNHIPTHLLWLDKKINFILGITGVILALVSIALVLALNALV